MRVRLPTVFVVYAHRLDRFCVEAAFHYMG